ncbi:uncharacterized protein G2W53_027180 [Senna tora]|uniref:Uncharacterized protein n=1 Tax=Senna tora TaxID=362788 RepID=A0A834TIV1_9FABA|nr:uncharacterized protein G2W53_027180 [Senna tora]
MEKRVDSWKDIRIMKEALRDMPKRDEEEERLEVKDILALNTFKNKIEEEIKPEVVQVSAIDTFGNPSTNTDTDSEATDVKTTGHVVNNHDTQAKNDEEEEGLELNNASMFFIKNETEEKMKSTLYSTSKATTEADWKLEEGMIPITAPDSSLREVVFYLPNTELAWKRLENGCPDVKMPKKRYYSRRSLLVLETVGEERKVNVV